MPTSPKLLPEESYVPEVQNLTFPPAGQHIVPGRADAVPDQEVTIVYKAQFSVDSCDRSMVPEEVAQVPAAASSGVASSIATTTTGTGTADIGCRVESRQLVDTVVVIFFGGHVENIQWNFNLNPLLS